jgi:hypothetical protein
MGSNGHMVRDARRGRAPHHEGLRPHPEGEVFRPHAKDFRLHPKDEGFRPHPEEPAQAGVSKDEATALEDYFSRGRHSFEVSDMATMGDVAPPLPVLHGERAKAALWPPFLIEERRCGASAMVRGFLRERNARRVPLTRRFAPTSPRRRGEVRGVRGTLVYKSSAL